MRTRFAKSLAHLALAVFAVGPASSAMVDGAWLAYPAGHVVSTKVVSIPAGGQAPLHRHPGVESVYLVAGGGTVQLGSLAPRELKAGDVLLIPAGTPHAFTSGAQETRIVSTYIVESGKPDTTLLETP